MLTNISSQHNTSVSDFSTYNIQLTEDGCPELNHTQLNKRPYKRLNYAEFTRIKHLQFRAAEEWCKEKWIKGSQLNYLRERVRTCNEEGISTVSQKQLAKKLQLTVKTIFNYERFFEGQGAIEITQNGRNETNTCKILVIQHLNLNRPENFSANITNTSCISYGDTSESNGVPPQSPDPDSFAHAKVELKPQEQLVRCQLHALGINTADTDSLIHYSKTKNMPPEIVQEAISKVKAVKAQARCKNHIGNPGGYFRRTLNQRFDVFKRDEREREHLARKQEMAINKNVSGLSHISSIIPKLFQGVAESFSGGSCEDFRRGLSPIQGVAEPVLGQINKPFDVKEKLKELKKLIKGFDS